MKTSAPLNSVHVYSYVSLLLSISLWGLDGFQVRQQQTSFFQHVTDIFLKQDHKQQTNASAHKLNRDHENSIRQEKQWGETFICLYLWVCECSRNSMALASSGSSVSDSSDPKPCSTWAISFTVTANVSMACHTHRTWLQATQEDFIQGNEELQKVCSYRAKDDPVTLAVLHFCSEVWRQVVFIDVAQQVADWAQHHHLQTHSRQASEAATQRVPWTLKRKKCFLLWIFSPASLTGSHPGWSESPDQCLKMDWGWCLTSQWGGAPRSNAGCQEMKSVGEKNRIILFVNFVILPVTETQAKNVDLKSIPYECQGFPIQILDCSEMTEHTGGSLTRW